MVYLLTIFFLKKKKGRRKKDFDCGHLDWGDKGNFGLDNSHGEGRGY